MVINMELIACVSWLALSLLRIRYDYRNGLNAI